MWLKCLVVGLGGFVGANARYLVGGWVQQRWGAGFPCGTFAVNISGSFALGLFAALTLAFPWSENWRLLIAIGFLGAYTTFSALSYETLQMLAHGHQHAAAALNAFGSMAAGLVAAYLGVVAARLLIALHGRL